MSLKISQGLKQSQSLTMTPQLQQAIKMLTLTHMEMTEVISQEMVENPLLEEKGAEKVQEETDYREDSDRSANADNRSESSSEGEKDNNTKDDFDWEKYIESYNSTSSSPRSASDFSGNDEQPNYENIVSQEMDLAEHLEWQIRMENLSGPELELALRIIGNLTDDGFLEIPFEEILGRTQGIEREEGERILTMIQHLDPVGCGASDTIESLVIQARSVAGPNPLVSQLVLHHLEDLYRKDYDKIQKKLGVDYQEVAEAELIVMSLNPKPGRLISTEHIHYITPDIYVREVSGEYVVEVNSDGIPQLKISQLYQGLLKKQKTAENKETQDFVQEKLRSAMWLIKSIENRQKTIEKVAKAILKFQPEFFRRGPEYLRPMILKDIAEEIGMHESTVSRVTTNKYMHTPIGTYELKYFFNSGVGGKDGGLDVASESLKLKIKQLIKNEDPKRPLSDQKIATILENSGINVARRTVAKYRESMNILSSSKRKKK